MSKSWREGSHGIEPNFTWHTVFVILGRETVVQNTNESTILKSITPSQPEKETMLQTLSETLWRLEGSGGSPIVSARTHSLAIPDAPPHRPVPRPKPLGPLSGTHLQELNLGRHASMESLGIKQTSAKMVAITSITDGYLENRDPHQGLEG